MKDLDALIPHCSVPKYPQGLSGGMDLAAGRSRAWRNPAIFSRNYSK